MAPQTSSQPNVTFVSIALVLASFSIVLYHQLTYQIVHDGGPLHVSVGPISKSNRTRRPIDMQGWMSPPKIVSTDGDGKFSLVLLSYRSPKSLQHTLRSLCRARIHQHAQFAEYLVYFQVFESEKDTKLVDDVFREPVCGKEFRQYRVIGHPSNFPVASATLRAIRNASSEFIMYIECDRPVVDVRHDAALLSQQVTAGIQLLRQRVADVYRMQLYSSRALDYLTSSLPLETYGPSPRTHCANVLRYNIKAPQFDPKKTSSPLPLLVDEAEDTNEVVKDNEDDGSGAPATTVLAGDDGSAAPLGICSHKAIVKKTLGNVFYTAYCKHWAKLTKTASAIGASLMPQQDMCDAFCFYQWASALLASSPQKDGAGVGEPDAVVSVRSMLKKVVTHHNIAVASTSINRFTDDEAAVTATNPPVVNVSAVCLTSSWCNWSNQPSLYRKEWYLRNIGGPCEDTPEGRGFCIGSPGRQSAVRQELFFVKRREHWAKKQHKICLGSGALIHHEVDNRE